MTQIAKWYERKFEFSFPVELYPDLCVRLRGTPARLEEMVRGRAAERMVRAMSGKAGVEGNGRRRSTLDICWS